MKDFFQQYPHAKSYFRVGERNFLNHCKKQAEIYAAQNDLVLETITPDYKEPVEEIMNDEPLKTTNKNNKASTKGSKSKNKNKS